MYVFVGIGILVFVDVFILIGVFVFVCVFVSKSISDGVCHC